jgi:hypothetical protein
VLEFTIVVGELQRGRIEEYQASMMIEELWRRFGVKMTMLVSFEQAFFPFSSLIFLAPLLFNCWAAAGKSFEGTGG